MARAGRCCVAGAGNAMEGSVLRRAARVAEIRFSRDAGQRRLAAGTCGAGLAARPSVDAPGEHRCAAAPRTTTFAPAGGRSERRAVAELGATTCRATSPRREVQSAGRPEIDRRGHGGLELQSRGLEREQAVAAGMLVGRHAVASPAVAARHFRLDGGKHLPQSDLFRRRTVGTLRTLLGPSAARA